MRLTNAMILTAGLGSRLQPLTSVRAKPAIPVGGEPLVRRIARWLAANGVTDIVLNLHHLPETIAAVMGDGSDLSIRARYSWEQPLLLGAAGGPRQALAIVGADTFFLINGDTLTDLELGALEDAHNASGARVTLALVPNREPDRYGGVRLDSGGRVVGFSPRGQAEESYHFFGVQVVQADVFRPLPVGRPAASIGGLYDQLIAREPGAVRGFLCEPRFWDVGTAFDYWSTSWSLTDAGANPAGAYGQRVHIDPAARVFRSILWDDVEVARDVVLEECVVTDGVRLPIGATYRRTILRQGPDGRLSASPLSIWRP
jgi:mannose-1-phosphate guanylyltransferase